MALEEGDDRALFDFWAWIEERRTDGVSPDFDLDDVFQVVEAVRQFDREAAHP